MKFSVSGTLASMACGLPYCIAAQMAFIGNPEYGVEFSPIDYARFAEACGGKGYYIKEPDETKSIIHFAMREKRPTLIEIEVDPFEPPTPPKTDMEFATNLAKSFARSPPYTSRIGLTLFRDKVHEVLKSMHSHNDIT